MKMFKKIKLVSVPTPAVTQSKEEQEFWKWYQCLKTKLTYPNLSERQLSKIGDSENQNVGLLSMASVLRDNNIGVEYLAPSLYFNGNKRDEDFLKVLIKNINEEKINYIGFSSPTCGIPTAIKYAQEIKKLNPQIISIIGGAHANGTSGQTLDELLESFDFVIRGKGEIPLLELIKGNKNVRGVSYKQKNKNIISPVFAEFSLKYFNPANDLLNVSELPAVRIFTSLGCRKGSPCVFCADLHNKGFATRPLEEVVNEIKYFYNNFSTRFFYFGDENFFFDKKRALQTMNAINSLDLDITVSYQARIESVDKDLIKVASEKGKCTEIQYGVESASQEILNLNKKGLRIKKVQEACDLTKSYGINTQCYFLVGLPGETKETAMLTMEKMEELLKKGTADFVEYRCAIPFPGAPMYDFAQEYGVKIKNKNWKDYRAENIPPFDLENLTATQIHEFYLSGLRKVTDIYKKRYVENWGNKIPDVNIISAVTEGGF